MTNRRVLWFALGLGLCVGLILWLVLPGGLAGKGDGVRADDNPLIDKVRSTWRAEDGETAEGIFAKVATVAHFVPRGWEVGRKTDTGERVVFSWAKHRSDKTTDENMVMWEVAPDGTAKLVTLYAKPMELGWQAFALSLVVDEVANNERGVNRRFLHDPANFNFVTTAQGKLGDLLRRGRCTIGEPVGVHYSPKADDQQAAEDDLWHVELSVGCNVQGLGDGAIIFERPKRQDWEPQSVFAKLFATSSPGSWFELAVPKDPEAFEPTRRTLQK
ncbi:nodulate formation efficiency C protein [Bradyrhizobium liaoningense]|uniref:nodulate formation efficiency C protein n=1 Tax=Bradyrhizobium liaoningense TaxID=43992 RepID=UPI0018723657|nr:nodulate formation efficiency C protein [Bradyrhizobium liaoningense]